MAERISTGNDEIWFDFIKWLGLGEQKITEITIHGAVGEATTIEVRVMLSALKNGTETFIKTMIEKYEAVPFPQNTMEDLNKREMERYGLPRIV